MPTGLAVRVLSADHPVGWRDGVLDGLSGQVIVDGKVVPAGRIWGICHDQRRQTPHEAPKDPAETGHLVLIACVVFPPDLLVELEAAIGSEWRDQIACAARALAPLKARPLEIPVLAATAANGPR